MILRDFVSLSAQKWSGNLAIESSTEKMTYRELDDCANRLAYMLYERGVRPHDRVGIWLEKSPKVIVAMQAVLRLNAVYVPLDPLSPVTRICTVIQNCQMRALVTSKQRETIVLEQGDFQGMTCFALDVAEVEFDWNNPNALSAKPLVLLPAQDDDLAYILYTSGSTGTPKGVCISNRNAIAFVEWAVDTLQAESTDRFANHAPFHFDLSVLDLYGAFAVGGTVVLISESIAYLPQKLLHFVREKVPTIWYVVPSVLILMMSESAFLDIEAHAPRVILFAGEPFPIKHLRRLREYLPKTRLLNLYGPTETNVCTYYEVKDIDPDGKLPVPIGRACSGDEVWAQKEDGSIAGPGEEGELMVAGPTVMSGYWGQPPYGKRPYATGDHVRVQEDGNYLFTGRRDAMVKIRGYRVEPGEIEAALLLHPVISEATVILANSGINAQLVAFIACVDQKALSLLEIKHHCSKHVPRYMIIDTVRVLPELPRTRNGKIDRLKLSEMAKEQEGV